MQQELCILIIAFEYNSCAVQVQEGPITESVKSGLLTTIMDMEESTVINGSSSTTASTGKNAANGTANSGKAFAPERPWHK
jgi:hypothetical protein